MSSFTLYIYDLEDNSHAATIVGDSQESVETMANDEFGSNDYGWTYSPAFSCSDGLVENHDARMIQA